MDVKGLLDLLEQKKYIRCSSHTRAEEVFRMLGAVGIKWRNGESLDSAETIARLHEGKYETGKNKTEVVLCKKSNFSNYDTGGEKDWLCWCSSGSYDEKNTVGYGDEYTADYEEEKNQWTLLVQAI